MYRNQNFPNQLIHSLFWIFAIFIVMWHFSACTKAETHASESLIGKWRVDSIHILYINKSPSGSAVTDSIWSAHGDLGTFDFSETILTYGYTIRNNKIMSSESYQLHSFKENAGFTKVRKWEIVLTGKMYKLEFGDQTSDAHKKAKNITLIHDPASSGKQQMEILHLSKK